jgi:amino acid transporter
VWNARLGTPVASLVVQCVITLVPVIAFGLRENGFASLILFTSPVFYFFFLLVGLAMVVLRRSDAKNAAALSRLGLSLHARVVLPVQPVHAVFELSVRDHQ